jgi:nucleoid-associated protein YgaU
MEPSTRIGVALCVLVAGVAIAGLFRKAPGPVSSPADRAEIQLTLRQPSSPTAPAAGGPAGDWRAAAGSTGEQPERPLASITASEAAPSAPPLPLPAVPEVAAADTSATRQSVGSTLLPSAGQSTASSPPTPGGTGDEEDWQLHEVVDGDTLASVALRYYGDAALAEALLRANHELVKNPDILPVGAFLKIPSRNSVGPTTARGEGWRKASGK